MSLQNRVLTLESNPLQTSNGTQGLQLVKPAGQAPPEQLSFSFAEEPCEQPQTNVAVICDWCHDDVRHEIGYRHRGQIICDPCCWREAEGGGW